MFHPTANLRRAQCTPRTCSRCDHGISFLTLTDPTLKDVHVFWGEGSGCLQMLLETSGFTILCMHIFDWIILRNTTLIHVLTEDELIFPSLILLGLLLQPPMPDRVGAPTGVSAS